MYKLVHFFKRYYTLFLFLALEIAAINYYMGATSYSRAKAQVASGKVTGWFQRGKSSVTGYFRLRRDNAVLLESLAAANNELAALGEQASEGGANLPERPYHYSVARVISNSVTRQENYFVIDKGARDGVVENMVILTPDESVAGYVQRTSDKFSVCMSVINRDFRIGGKIKGRDELFGSVYWDGTDYRTVTLSDIPRYAAISVGDTILSSYSLRFPPDTYIGTIKSFADSGDGTYYEIKVELGAKMSSLRDVLLVKYADAEELDALAGGQFPDRPGMRNIND